MLDFAARIVDAGRLNFGGFPSQTHALACVQPPLGQHKGQVKKFNINEKKNFLHQQGDCEEPIKVYKSSSHPGIILQ